MHAKKTVQLQSAIAQVKGVLFWYGILVQLSLINETKTKKNQMLFNFDL